MTELIFSWPGLAAAIALVLAGAIQGSTGFGFNMLAAPLLALIDPAFVPGPMIALATLVSVGGALREAKDINRSDLGFALAGRLLAAGAAAWCVGLMSQQAFSLFFGLTVLIAVAVSLSGLRITTTPRTLFFAGTVSGFMGTLTSMGAAPMALVYQNTGGARMRATLNAFFVVGGVISIMALVVAGQFSRHDLQLAAVMIPPAAAGFLLSGWGKTLVDKGQMKPLVLLVSGISGAMLLWKAFA